MKRYFTLLVLFAAILQMTAQTTTTYRRPLWVGLDMGGTWQSSDMKALGGIGWSFTLSRYSRLDKNGPLYFGWRFRFLDGRNYGYNYHRLYSIQNDPALNTGATNYATPTVNNDGYVFSNYRMRFDEFAYELIIGSQGLRKHGVLLYAFGGAGLTHWKTTTNQLGALGEQYDYSGVSTDGNDAVVKAQLQAVWQHGDYETLANGSKSSGQWNFMPSAGVGFGYQFSDAVAIGIEHRTTWALNDYIDGVNHNSAGEKTPNDVYNYDGFFVRWTFGGGHSSNTASNNPPPPNNPNNYTPNPNNPTNPNNTYHPTDPVVTNPTNPTNPQNNTPVYPPTVRFTTPYVEPYNATTQNQQLVVNVEHVNFSSQITLVINNQVSTNFSFNPNTNTMVFNHVLNVGTNIYQVTATNNYGSATDIQTIIFQNGQSTTTTVTLPPSVIINNPATDPYTSSVQNTPVSATVLNVNSVSGILVRKNGNAINGWSFDPNSHLVTFTANLTTGSNLYEVIGTNSVGSASDAVTILYNPAPTMLPPVVTITNPSACPYSTKSQNMTISANITNVTAPNQVNIVFNNQNVSQFNFVNYGSYATVSFPVVLVAGVNPFTITGTNTAGTNSQSCSITYKVTTQNPPVPPVVTITAPASSPYTSSTSSYTVNANVINVGSQNEITVTQNNITVTNWTYSMTTHQLILPAALVTGNNVFTVTASNINGSDSKSTTIIYAPAAVPPVVTITNPSSSPYTSQNQTFTVTATVLNVANSGEIAVTQNNSSVSNWTYNMMTHILTLPSTLVNGNNVFTVTASNHNGSDSKSTTIIYAPVVVLPPVVTITVPNVNPFITSTPNQTLQAQVLNVTSSSQITVTQFMVGAVPFSFNANTHMVSFNVVLSLPSSKFTVTATNSAGTASDDETMKLIDTQDGSSSGDPDPGNPKGGNSNTPPAVRVGLTLVNPNTESSTTTNASAPVSLIATGINSASEISVTVNSAHLANFNYDANTHTVSFNTALNSGANTIVVTAQNSNGSATVTLTINYTSGRSSSQSSGGRGNSSSSSSSSGENKGGGGRTTTSGGGSTTTSGGSTTTSGNTSSSKPDPKPDPKPESKPLSKPDPKPDPKPAPRDTPKPVAPAPTPGPTPSKPR